MTRPTLAITAANIPQLSTWSSAWRLQEEDQGARRGEGWGGKEEEEGEEDDKEVKRCEGEEEEEKEQKLEEAWRCLLLLYGASRSSTKPSF